MTRFQQFLCALDIRRFKAPYSGIVCNIPHSGTKFPAGMAEWYAEQGVNLLACASLLTDHYTNRLFGAKLLRTTIVECPLNRICCDVERLIDDPLEARGLGIQYDLSLITGLEIAPRPTKESMMKVYTEHHNQLKKAIEKSGRLPLLLDCHSFSERDNVLNPNAHENKDIDICIGYNEDATKPDNRTLYYVAKYFRKRGYRVAFNTPFSNSMTVDTNHPYHSMMIEVNKHCYMNEDTLEETEFGRVYEDIVILEDSLHY